MSLKSKKKYFDHSLFSGGVIVGDVPVHSLLECLVQGGELEIRQILPKTK
jgi:hypothetical protein